MTRIEISGTGLPNGTTVRLDGEDISRDVHGVALQLDGRSVPTVVLDVIVQDINLGVGQAEVRIPDGTRDLLIRLGWTPPPGAGA